MGCDAAQGFQSRLAVKAGASASINWASDASLLEITNETIKKKSTLVNTAGLRGTRSRELVRTREGIFSLGGAISLNPSPRDFGILLPLAGFALTTTYDLTEGLAVFGVLVDRVTDIFEYEDCLCSSLVIRGSEGQIVDMTFELVSENEDIAGAPAFPTLSLPDTLDTNPFMFFDAAFVLAGTTYQANSFEIAIQNVLDVKYRNSQKPSSFCASDRIVTLKLNVPYTASEIGLYPLSSVSGLAGSVTLTNGTVSTLFTFPKLRTPNETPTIPGRSEITLNLEFQALATSLTKEIVITNDETA